MNNYEAYIYDQDTIEAFRPGQILRNYAEIVRYLHWRERAMPGKFNLSSSLKVAFQAQLYRRIITGNWRTYPIYDHSQDMLEWLPAMATPEEVAAAYIRREYRRGGDE